MKRRGKNVRLKNSKPNKLTVSIEEYLPSDEHIKILLRTTNSIQTIRRILSYNIISQQQLVELIKVSPSTSHTAIMRGRLDFCTPFQHRQPDTKKLVGPKFIIVNDKFWDYVKLMWDSF
jgi:hypothetical protein